MDTAHWPQEIAMKPMEEMEIAMKPVFEILPCHFGLHVMVYLSQPVDNRKNLMNKTDNLTVVQQQCEFALLEEQGEESLDKMQFTGPFPAAILEIPNLLYLDLRFNSFSGQIPQDFFSKNLDAIFLNNNQFDGKIPQTLGNSPASVINLANNKLTGDIPVNFGYTSPKLKEILFMNTKIKNIPFAALSVKLAKEKGGYCCKRGGKSDDVWLIYRFSVKMMRGPNSMGLIDLSSDGDAVKWCNDLYGGREDKAAVGWWRGWKRVEESDIGLQPNAKLELPKMIFLALYAIECNEIETGEIEKALVHAFVLKAAN
ncbi:hypothetical protein LXL04_014597 [Taraxacum kok-saghyz]